MPNRTAPKPMTLERRLEHLYGLLKTASPKERLRIYQQIGQTKNDIGWINKRAAERG